MDIIKLLNIEKLKHTDLFRIRSFIVLFSIYSVISIWSADAVYQRAIKIKKLKDEVKLLKAEYVHVKSVLMYRTKQSQLLEQAEKFGFKQSHHPVKVIYSAK